MTITIDCDDPVAQGWMARLLRLPPSPSPAARMRCSIRKCEATEGPVTSDAAVEPRYTLHGQDRTVLAHGTLGEVMEATARLVGNHTACHYDGGLALHAGCVAHKGHGILIPGASGAGKTTLTAWLLHRGLGYLTDELVLVPEAADTVVGWTRPLHVKTGAWRRVTRWLAPCEPLHHPSGAFVPAEALGAPAPAAVTPHTVLFPCHDPAAAVRVQPLTPAQTAHRLWCVTANTARLPLQGFHQVTQLARRLRALALTYADVAQLEGMLAEFLNASPDA